MTRSKYQPIHIQPFTPTRSKYQPIHVQVTHEETMPRRHHRPHKQGYSDAVIRVGDGRGFIVKDAGRARLGWRNERIVITAAHCLPFLPPCHAFSYLEDRTYKALLGPLGQEPTVWAECLFADLIADIAVLGEPDSQELSEQWNAFEALVMAVTPLRITDAPKEAQARLLSLAGEWFDCKVQHVGGPLLITDANKGTVGGMSGSPIWMPADRQSES